MYLGKNHPKHKTAFLKQKGLKFPWKKILKENILSRWQFQYLRMSRKLSVLVTPSITTFDILK